MECPGHIPWLMTPGAFPERKNQPVTPGGGGSQVNPRRGPPGQEEEEAIQKSLLLITQFCAINGQLNTGT